MRASRPRLTFGPYLFDPDSRMLSRAGVELQLPPRVIGVLEVLLRRAGDVVPRQELIESVWKDAFVTDTSLAEAVSALRQALGDDPQTPTYVQTLHRRGYRFVAPVAEGSSDTVQGAPVAAPPFVEPPPQPVPPTISGQLLPWSLAVICAVVAIVAISQLGTSHEAPDPPVTRFVLTLPAGTRLDGRASALAISSDGATIAWSGCDGEVCRLYTRKLDRLQPEVLSGTEGASAPFFSPDARWIAFFADGKLKKAALAGGAPVTLADAPAPLGGVWTHEREIIYAGSPTAGLWRIADGGGEPGLMTEPRASTGEVAHVWPSLTPGGDALLFTLLGAPGNRQGQLGARAIGVANPAEGWRSLTNGVGVAAGATRNVIVFSRGSELQAAWFDSQRLSMPDAPPLVVSAVAHAQSGSQFALSASGAFLFAEPSESSSGALRWLVNGEDRAAPDLDRPLQLMSLSTDGSRIAGVDDNGARSEIWVADTARGTTTRVTHGGENTSPIWSGHTLFYAARSSGTYEIWKQDVDAAASPAKVYGGARSVFPVAVTRDGSSLAFLQTGNATRSDLWLLPLAGGEAMPLVQTAYEDLDAAFSPDGSLVAYQSNEGGRWDVYALRRSDGKRSIVSRAGGTHPIWAPDGSALLYESGSDLFRVPFESSGEFRFGTPVRIASIRDATVIGIDANARLLIKRMPSQPASVVVVLHWVKELAERLGPPPAFLPR